jgi:hypothetical protein
MKILYLTKDERSSELKSKMTDHMWQQARILYHEDNPLLIMEDGTRVEGTNEILKHLSPQGVTFFRKLLNAKEAMVRTLRQVINGKDLLVDKSIMQTRRDLCSACPFNQSSFLGNTCTKCGCNIRAKTKLVAEFCPMEKW